MSQQKSPVNLLDLMTPEDREKVKQREQRLQEERKSLIGRQWMMLSELGCAYGWGAVQSVFNDEITLYQANMLVDGARKVHDGYVYDSAVATLAATSPNKGTFNNLMKSYRNNMRVE